MAEEEIRKVSAAYPMKGGDGPNSYAKNSSYQRKAMESVKELVTKEIAEKLDIDLLLPCNAFHIVDLGCSVGPNTFSAVENILEAVQLKCQSQGQMNLQIPEFQVFFNDHTPNDFNLLFKALPPNRQYYAMGVPGSFYGRLFPTGSIHLFHSSFALQWLSEVPKEVVDKNSPAWNKGRIHYLSSTDEVVRAYKAQYLVDMECFLHARAQELVDGGLIVLFIPGYPHGTPLSDAMAYLTLQLIEACLIDMVTKGMVSEEKLDSFNMPMFFPSSQELEAVVERNGCLSIETLKTIPWQPYDTALNTKLSASPARAAFEGLIEHHFGEEILDELFDLYRKKLEEKLSIAKPRKTTSLLVVLKRKAN